MGRGGTRPYRVLFAPSRPCVKIPGEQRPSFARAALVEHEPDSGEEHESGNARALLAAPARLPIPPPGADGLPDTGYWIPDAGWSGERNPLHPPRYCFAQT